MNVVGFNVWSINDNFEWADGYTARFGMIHVDFDSQNRVRTPKQSFYCYKDIIAHNSVIESENGKFLQNILV